MKFITAYAATLLALIALDMLWLGLIAQGIYAAALGHLLAAQPDVVVALLFYSLFSLGLTLFAVVPHAAPAPFSRTLKSAALFGFFTYMTYDLSNLATLRDWPGYVAAIDIVWGVVVSCGAAACGRVAMDWLGRKSR